MLKNVILRKYFFRLAYRVFLWHFKYFFSRRISPLACGFYLTSQCNFQCKFCNIWKIEPAFQFSEDDARKIIEELGNRGVIYFSFSGGEPLLVAYVFDLLAYAKKAGILYTHIVSNGYLLDKNKAWQLAKAEVSEISLSLDGDEKIHDKNRGRPGAFEKVMEAVQNVKTYAPKTMIVLNALLDSFCPENALSAVKIAESLRVKIKIQPLNNHPSFRKEATNNQAQPSLQINEKRKLLEIIDLIKKSSAVVNSKAFLENYKSFVFFPENLALVEDNCVFGYHHIEIFGKQLFPCLEGLNWENGFDISIGSIDKIVNSNSYREILQKLKKCSSCRKNYYVCYYEPRLNFPVKNFIKTRIYTLLK